MQLRQMNLNLLVALDELLCSRSVTRAAEATGVSQPAMSRSLKQLRELFGDQLLVRGADGMTLTPLALRVAQPLRRTLDDLSRVVNDRPRFDPSTSTRTFRIAMPDYLQMLLGSDLMSLVVERAPHVSLSLKFVDRENYTDLLESGELDVVVHACFEPPSDIAYAGLVLDRFACAVREEHPVITTDDLTLETYAALPHCLIAISDSETPGSVDLALEKVGLRRHVACRVRSFLAAPEIVSRSNAITTAPERLLRRFAERVPLRIFTPPVALHDFEYTAHWHERFDDDPGHQWLRDLLIEVGLQHDPHEGDADWRDQWGTRGSRRRREIERQTDGTVI